MSPLILLVIAASIFLILIIRQFFIKKQSSYWSSHNFPSIGSEVKGSFLDILTSKKSFIDVDGLIYNHSKSNKIPAIGFSEFTQKTVLISDLELIKHIMVKDFDYFINRRQFFDPKKDSNELFAKALFFMENDDWKELRSKMTPTFTTGKIRRMFNIFESSTDKIIDYLTKQIDNENNSIGGPEIEFIDCFGRYTMDIIASCAFGIDAKTFKEVNPIFQVMGKKMQFDFTWKLMLTFAIRIMSPWLASVMGLRVTDKDGNAFFTNVIKNAIKHRESTGEKRNDFLQIMLEARDEAAAQAQHLTTDYSSKEKVVLTDESIIAQSVLFILAGFDTTQTLLIYVAYELALNPEIQEKLYNEIDTEIQRNGKFTYETINNLEYLDQVINETLRRYPPVPRLERRAMADYKIPGTDLIIPEGTVIALPTFWIQRDKEYYQNSDKFDPEHFTTESKNSRNPFAFQPFGHGPRNCIGMRFALTNSKLVIANIIHKFYFEPSENTTIPMDFAKLGTLKPKDGKMLLRLKARNN